MALADRPAALPERCFGVDAEDESSVVLVERRDGQSLAPERFALDSRGLAALAHRVARQSGRAKVCVGSRGPHALDVATHLMQAPHVALLLLFERGRPACREAADQARHASELARNAERAV